MAISRYQETGTAEYTSDSGKTHRYLLRRFLPAGDSLQAISEHAVVEGDRLDLIADQYFGDAELFWRVADGNDAMLPADLTSDVGTRLRITLPAGVTGPIQ